MMAVGVRWIGGPFFGFMNIGRGGMKRRRGTKSSRRRKTPGGGKNGPPSRRTTTTSRAARSQPRELLQQAMQHHLSGRLETARTIYEQILSMGSDEPELRFNLGQCLVQLDRADDAIPHLERAAEITPHRAGYLTALANACSVASKFDRALEIGKRAALLNPKDDVAHYLVAYSLEQLGPAESALGTIQTALEVVPESGRLRVLRAHLLGRSGRRDEAIHHLRTLLETDSTSGSINRSGALHELAMLLDKTGQYDEAFEAFRQCGEETRRSPTAANFNREVRFRRIRSFRASVTRELLEPNASTQGVGDGPTELSHTPRPAFLIGFPRSGTTMTEQILAAHPDIETGDEWPLITTLGNAAVKMVGGQTSPAGMLTRLTKSNIGELRNLYWNEVQKYLDHVETTAVFVDKMPLNLIDLPLINIVFPEAKIVMAIRDPRDVCLSCFMQDFRLNNSMIHFLSIADSAEFYESVMDLYLHLRTIVTIDVLEVRYEDTVANLERQGKRLLEHLGVEWNDDILAFHQKAKKRMISTPSAAAVREPVHNRAVARWKNYEEYLKPVMPRLQRFISEFGYDVQ